MPSLHERLYGSDEAPTPVRELRAGALTAQLRGHWLRHICWGGREIWHGLAPVLRDADWGTPEPTLMHSEVREDEQAFEVRLQGRFTGLVPFSLHAIGQASGELRLEVTIQPEADLHLQRLGLCLLHPLDVRGAAVEVTHVDGRLSASTFPQHIAPWPPFMLVRALRHAFAPGRWATATLVGDVFETEDQRNNADASFKTYSRSNMAPRPYRVGAGVPLRQSAHLKVESPAATLAPAHALEVSWVPAQDMPWPDLGIEIHADDALEPAMLAALRELGPAYLHFLWRPGQNVHWPNIAKLLEAAGARLRLDALLPADEIAPRDCLRNLRSSLTRAGIVCEAVAVFPSHHAHIAAAREVFPQAAVGGGTPHFFVQLSRLDDLGPVDFASFTTASIVHGVQDDDVMLGLASLTDMVDSWRARHPALPLRVGPSAIAARSSPLGAQPPSDGTRRVALAGDDPRTRGQFGAAWALGHVAGLAQPSVQALSVLSLSGANGIVRLSEGGAVQRSAAFHLLAALGGATHRLPLRVSDTRRLAALALRRQGRTQGFIGNLGCDPADVQLQGLPPGSRVCVLDAEQDAPPAWRSAGPAAPTLHLAPYAVACIEAPAPHDPPSSGSIP